jgi:hypothetical protein
MELTWADYGRLLNFAGNAVLTVLALVAQFQLKRDTPQQRDALEQKAKELVEAGKASDEDPEQTAVKLAAEIKSTPLFNRAQFIWLAVAFALTTTGAFIDLCTSGTIGRLWPGVPASHG